MGPVGTSKLFKDIFQQYKYAYRKEAYTYLKELIYHLYLYIKKN